MYCDYWGLKEKPFENLINQRFYYNSRGHQEASSRLQYAIREKKQAALLCGEYGVGKTMICRMLPAFLSDEFTVFHVSNPLLSVVEIFRELVWTQPASGQEVAGSAGVEELIRRLKESFIRNINAKKHNVLLVDDAHLIDEASLFERLRLLNYDYQYGDKSLLTLVFVGQDELRNKIRLMPALEQRISIQAYIEPWGQDEIEPYILHRLSAAGCREPRKIFQSPVFAAIYKHSGGVPRLINTICDLALLSGFQDGAASIGAEIIQNVLHEVPRYQKTAGFGPECLTEARE